MLCAGGEGGGTNKVALADFYLGVTLLTNDKNTRGTVGDLSLWRKMASTPWKASLAMDFQ